jgi:signal transduction histidine kinase/ligand-binding sensor domain-containing protein/ActR/RegA family two-component response regulator
MFASLVLSAVLAITPLGTTSGGSGVPAASMISASSGATSLPTPQFRRFGIADGLPGGQVYNVVQDSRGLMWFGSAGGLVRYDGIEFKVFRHALDTSGSLPFNAIYTLFADSHNRIWSGGISGGLEVYDQANGRFRLWQHDEGDAASLSSNEVWSIAQTTDGALWVATQDGLDRMRADEAGFDHAPLQPGASKPASSESIRALFAAPDGRLWIGAESGLYVRSTDGRVRRVAIDSAYHGNMHNIWAIEGDSAEVRIAFDGGLMVVGADDVARPLLDQPASRVLSSSRDSRGRLWIGKADGLVLDERNGGRHEIDGHPLLPGGLPGNKIWHTAIDREGGLWITFEESYVAYLPPGWDGFTRFTHIPDDPGSMSDVAASAIHLSRDGKLWVGGDDGWIDKLDVHSGRVQHVLKDAHGQAVSFAEDARERLWIAVPGGLQVFDHGKVRSIDTSAAHVSRPVLLAAADRGPVYVASWGEGVFAIDPDTLAITPVPMEGATPAAETLLPSQFGMRDGNLWYASTGGLMRLDRQTGELTLVPGVPLTDVLAFDFDAGGFWLLTKKALRHYHYADGSASCDKAVDTGKVRLGADLVALRVDQQNTLWVFGNPGLWRFDAATDKFVSFGPMQGLATAEFGSSTSEIASNGVIFASDSGGVVAFQPRHLQQMDELPSRSAPPPLLTLTSVDVRRNGSHQELLSGSSTIHLGWRDRDLKVEARVASYVNPAGNRYRFQLKGFDTDWVDVGSRGEREFAGLPAGDYVLDVIAAGATGTWSHLVTPLTVHVQAPPWLRWWAWLIYAALLILMASAVLYGWRRRLAQRHHMQLVEQQRQMAENASAAKTQFLATLSHEIRTPMTGVMGMAELLLSTPLTPLQQDYTRAMQRSGSMLLKLLNDALDLARIEAGRLELEPVPFDPRQLLEEVSQLEQGLAHARGLRFALELAEDLPLLVIGDALRIKQVLLNLANNALKFTEQGRVTLRAEKVADGLVFSVSDTGPGIPEASQARLFQRFEQEQGPQRRAGSGLGLAICRELVDTMGGSIELESRVGHGSTFRVRLPLIEPAASTADGPVKPFVAGIYRLLLVEDDTIAAAVIRGLLERQGHTVVHVGNGLAALAEVAHASFDAALLDLDLPGVDGFQTARLIRQREGVDQHLPIVAVTARTGSQDEARARAAGMDGFLQKPLTGEQLGVAIARIVAPAREE